MQRLKRTLVITASVGFTIAIFLGLLWLSANKGGGHNSILDYATTVLWPTSIVLMSNENSGPALNGLLLILSAIANGAIYAAIVFAAVTCWRFLRRAGAR